MAMNKIERIDREIAKTREKITEYQNKLRGLEAQKTEAENLQIVQLVRSMRLSPHELSAMLSGGGIPGMEAALLRCRAAYFTFEKNHALYQRHCFSRSACTPRCNHCKVRTGLRLS